VQTEAVGDPAPLLLGRPAKRLRVDAVVGHIDAIRVGAEYPDQLISGGVGRNQASGGAV
jgi:hypothetical protein